MPGWVCLHSQDICRASYRVDGDTGPGGPTVSRLQVDLKRFILDSGTLGGSPLTSHKAGRQVGGLQVPDWRPGVVRQGGGTLRSSSQELLMDQVLLLAVEVRACTHNIVQAFPEET